MDIDNKVNDLRISIDRGGTFTDCYASWVFRDPILQQNQARNLVIKLLSEDPQHYKDAPTEGIRRILSKVFGKEIGKNEKIKTDKIESIRMGTTVATNALLERKGEAVCWVTTKGFKDLLKIGNQSRPKIFDLTARKADTLYSQVVEVEERVAIINTYQEDLSHYSDKDIVTTISGEFVHIIKPIDEDQVYNQLKQVYDSGIRSLAISLLHSFIYPNHEKIVLKIAQKVGFVHITVSSEHIPMAKLVPRGNSSCADAYLTPHLQRYIKGFSDSFDKGVDRKLLFMQSDGGLASVTHFNGFRAILSGPAAGVVGFAKTSWDDSENLPLIGFDMGGTSTDISRYDGRWTHIFETVTAGIPIQAPQLDIVTVAAGGGSRLFFKNGLFVVGPESAGAHPGPICYRKGGYLAVTDANLCLGRVVPKYFPSIFGPDENQPLDEVGAKQEFIKVAQTIKEINGKDLSVDEVAFGFIKVANEAMCRPIRMLTESKGWDTSKHALCCFGGAGGQHACAIATTLGIKKIILHKHASILSAYGLSLSDVVREIQEPCSLTLSTSTACHDQQHSAAFGFASANHFTEILSRINQLVQKCTALLSEEGFQGKQIATQAYLNLRYEGTDCPIMIPQGESEDFNFVQAFLDAHQQEFGFKLPDRNLVIDGIRVRGVGSTPNLSITQDQTPYEEINNLVIFQIDATSRKPDCYHSIYFEIGGRQSAPVYSLENLKIGDRGRGPLLIVEANSTIVVEPNWEFTILTNHVILSPTEFKLTNEVTQSEAEITCDPVKLSIFSNRFMSIAEQMGKTLEKTSVSTNIKERLDFSCALFGPDGSLVANAPHIPVHLGSLGYAVKYQLEYFNKEKEKGGEGLNEGDVILTNHPSAGGSHLPDLSVITPVFYNREIVFFVASRGHHADIGGILPGSMPPTSKYLYEEGAAIKSFKLLKGGILQTEGVIKILSSDPAKYPGCVGTRALKDNLSDLKAQVAANYKGIQLVNLLIKESGLKVVQRYMEYIQHNAEFAVRNLLKKIRLENKLNDNTLHSVDFMDDGTPIELNVSINGEGGAKFDFTGTGPQVFGNINAPESVSRSAILYCLRCMVNEDIPLNEGCLTPIEVIFPPNSLLSPSEECAVVGGNVLTSQRVVDVVLKAFEVCAASQGCCNNLTFGKTATNPDGTDGFGYYETIAGGSGAGDHWSGQDAVHTHMTNTRITDPEILERRYPVILNEFSIRKGSGGKGKFKGGDGVRRDIIFKVPLQVSILSERRSFAPYGLKGGGAGQRGLNIWISEKGVVRSLGGKSTVNMAKGDRIVINTPGGGAYGCSK